MSARDDIAEHFTSDALADDLLDAHDAEVRRAWSERIREAGTAKGWSVWAAAFLDPDVPFVDTGMPSTETIVAELRRLDRAAVLREAADAITAVINADRAQFPRRSNDRAALGGAREIVLSLIDKPRSTTIETEREKGTSGGSQPPAGESTPAPTELLAHATAFEVPRPGNLMPLLLQRSYAGGDRWAICDREGRRWDQDDGWMYEGQHLDERTRTDTRFPLAEAWPLAHRIAAGEPIARATDEDGASQ